MNPFRYYSKRSITVFFISVICLSAVAEYLICRYQYMWAYPVLMWMPAVSAMIASAVAVKESGEPFTLKKLFSNVGFHTCKIRYVLAGILLPLLYLLVPYMIYWKMYPENFAYSGVPLLLVLKDCLPVGIIGIFTGLLTATGEEIGWRGFLVPALREKVDVKKALLITGLFWCLWHFPLLIWGGYTEGLPLFYSLFAFALCIFPLGIICGLLALQSGSVWPCAFLHAAHNNYDQAILGIITRGPDKMYYVGETGIFTIVCVWVIAIVMYISFLKRNETRYGTGRLH